VVINGTSPHCPGGFFFNGGGTGVNCYVNFAIAGLAPRISCDDTLGSLCLKNESIYWLGETNSFSPPPDYEFYLRASPSGGKKYTWTITSGQSYALFGNGSSKSIVTGKSVQIFTKNDPGNTLQDVQVTVSIDGGPTSAPFTIHVRKPYFIDVTTVADRPDPNGGGYQSHLRARVIDQFGDDLPFGGLNVHETPLAKLKVIPDLNSIKGWPGQLEFNHHDGEVGAALDNETSFNLFLAGPVSGEPRSPRPRSPCEPSLCQQKVAHWCDGSQSEYMAVESAQVATFERHWFTDHGRLCDLAPPASGIPGQGLPSCPASNATSCPN